MAARRKPVPTAPAPPAPEPTPPPVVSDPAVRFFRDCYAYARTWIEMDRRDAEQEAARRSLADLAARLVPNPQAIGKRPHFVSLDLDHRPYVLMFARIAATGAIRITLYPAPRPSGHVILAESEPESNDSPPESEG